MELKPHSQVRCCDELLHLISLALFCDRRRNLLGSFACQNVPTTHSVSSPIRWNVGKPVLFPHRELQNGRNNPWRDAAGPCIRTSLLSIVSCHCICYEACWDDADKRKRFKPLILVHLQDFIWDRTLFLFLSPFLLFHVFDAAVAIFLPERHDAVRSTYVSYSKGPSFESRLRDFVSDELYCRGSIPGRNKNFCHYYRCDQSGWVPIPGCGPDYKSSHSTEAKNAWSYTSTPQYGFTLWCLVKHRDKWT